jgi:formylglycine-generating enzyme required for sulfatase activity
MVKIVINRTQKTGQCYIEDLGNGIRLEMVLIPKGSFMMGSPADKLEPNKSESPQHRVDIKQICLGKYPVTQAQWQAVAAFPKVNKDLDSDPSNFKGANRPVEQVSWYDAVEFCDRLSNHTKRQYSLPSEAQWEYACRAGTTTPFHFGKTITSELANYDATGTYGAGEKGTYREQTTEVGSLNAANAFGLYDMHGNVCEWCLDDWHNNYEGAPQDGSAWFNNDDKLFNKSGQAMLRGGSWDNIPQTCRSAFRNSSSNRDIINNDIGFRVVCAVGRILELQKLQGITGMRLSELDPLIPLNELRDVHRSLNNTFPI